MKVSQKLFGYNLECTRRVGYSGLYAEMLRNNRLSAGAEGFYPVAWDGMEGWGQCSERIHLRAGQTYEMAVAGGEKNGMRLRTEYGTVLFESHSPRARFRSSYTIAHARFEAVSSGSIRYLSLRPADAFHGCRRDVLDAIRELHPGTIRVPGGCFAERYAWKEGLLAPEERPVITDGGLELLFSANDGYDGYELNIDDYAAVCRYAGAEIEYTVRLSEEDPQNAADLVEYCNGGPESPWGAKRILRGYDDPYRVKTWYIGNEIAWLRDSRLSDAEYAAGVNDAYVRAMRQADPAIRTVASTGNVPAWDVHFLQTAKEVDLCGHHYYLFDTHPETDPEMLAQAGQKLVLPRLLQARQIFRERPFRFPEREPAQPGRSLLFCPGQRRPDSRLSGPCPLCSGRGSAPSDGAARGRGVAAVSGRFQYNHNTPGFQIHHCHQSIGGKIQRDSVRRQRRNPDSGRRFGSY